MFAYLFLRNSTDPSLRTDPSLSTDPSLDSTQIRLYLWETLQYLNIHRRHRFIQIKHMYITWLKKIQGTPNQVLLQRIIFKFEADCWWEKHTVSWLSNITSNDENFEICSVAWSDHPPNAKYGVLLFTTKISCRSEFAISSISKWMHQFWTESSFVDLYW